MIQIQTYLNVADNSGARKLVCIQILGASNHNLHILVMLLSMWLRKQY